MHDSDEKLHQRPDPSKEPEHKDENEQHGNRLAIGLAIFIPIGIALGLTVFDNIGLGAAAGIGMGSIYGIVAGRFADGSDGDSMGLT